MTMEIWEGEPINVDLAEVDTLRGQLRVEQETNLLLTESMAELELIIENQGWREIGQTGKEFSAGILQTLRGQCRAKAISNPILKSGLNKRIAYVWGRGVEISAADQDVNAVIQEFMDANQTSVFGSQAQEELERAEGTDGEVFLACFTLPYTGKVQVRSTPSDEIVDIITNPNDRDDPWFYVREYESTVIESSPLGFYTGNKRVRELHPALGYYPTQRPRRINDCEVIWEAPMLHVPVNRLDGWQRGLPDVYAALAWAQLYRDFLVDWAGLTKALSKLAFQATGDTSARVKLAASAARQNAQTTSNPAGQTVAAGPGIKYEAVSKSGATIDSESGRPLAGMVAAGLGIPVTMLLADPGVTGARAVAETLDPITILEMGMRRKMWQAKLDQLLQYVIDQAVIAPRGELQGVLSRDDWGKLKVELAGDTDDKMRTIDFEWPPMADVDPVGLITAIVQAEGTGLIPDVTTVKLLLNALGVKDVDEIVEQNVDKTTGEWIPARQKLERAMNAGAAAMDKFDKGDDPASQR